jgi:hypothetical protein
MRRVGAMAPVVPAVSGRTSAVGLSTDVPVRSRTVDFDAVIDIEYSTIYREDFKRPFERSLLWQTSEIDFLSSTEWC